MLSLHQAEINNGTRVFVAADLDVSIENGEILDTFRLDCMLPTLKYIISKGGIPVIAGHMGRPKGKIVSKLSTQSLCQYFDKFLGPGKYELLENLRFDAQEEAGDDNYALMLAGKADIYVNEVFSTCHRKDASIVGVPKYLPAYAGMRLEQEITTLKNLTANAERPFIVIIGGAKLEDKKPVASKFLEIADQILLGGKIGLQWIENIPQKMVIPTDYAEGQNDIGNETISIYSDIISKAKTILWAGPMGKYENPQFMNGSIKIAEAVVKATQETRAKSVAGGGDTINILTALGLRDKISFVSSGGGAMLDFLAYGTLPGIQALEKEG